MFSLPVIKIFILGEEEKKHLLPPPPFFVGSPLTLAWCRCSVLANIIKCTRVITLLAECSVILQGLVVWESCQHSVHMILALIAIFQSAQFSKVWWRSASDKAISSPVSLTTPQWMPSGQLAFSGQLMGPDFSIVSF